MSKRNGLYDPFSLHQVLEQNPCNALATAVRAKESEARQEWGTAARIFLVP